MAPSDRSGVAIRGGAIRVAGYALGVLVSLAAATILVRHLGVSTFGRYVTVTSLIGLVGGLTEAGIYVYGIREFAVRGEHDRRELMANLLTMRLALTLIGIGLAMGFALIAGYEETLLLGCLIVGAGLLVQVTADVLSISPQAQLQLGRLTIVDLFRRVVAAALIGALAIADASLLPFFAATTLAGAAALVLLGWMVRSSITIRLCFDRQAWRRLLADTLPYAVAVSIAAVYLYVTVIVMSLIASAHQTGLFATSFRVIQVLLAIPVLLLTAVFPLMFGNRAQKTATSGEMVGKVFDVALICGVWISGAVALGAPLIIHVIGGSKAHGAVPVLRIQSLVLVASFVSTSSALTLLTLRRYGVMIVASSAALALNLALALVLVPALGAEGGAVGDAVAEAAVAIGLTIVVTRAVPTHQIKRSILPPLLVASLSASAVLLIPAGSLLRVVAATCVYFGVLILFGAIPKEVTGAALSLRNARTTS